MTTHFLPHQDQRPAPLLPGETVAARVRSLLAAEERGMSWAGVFSQTMDFCSYEEFAALLCAMVERGEIERCRPKAGLVVVRYRLAEVGAKTLAW